MTYFNPRSHEGSDLVYIDDCVKNHEISIHAPTRGATFHPRYPNLPREISIHAPTRGATSTTPEDPTVFPISIHAPTRGATMPYLRQVPVPQNFNPRSHEGSDTNWSSCLTWVTYFNPRSHEGSDPSRYRPSYLYYNFNPRSHEGSDLCRSRHDIQKYTISIHAPTRGATKTETILVCSCQFQSTLPRGERPTLFDFMLEVTHISIHAPTRGATVSTSISSSFGNYFNPRSHEGSDLNAVSALCRKWLFQSTLPRGERLCYQQFSVCVQNISIHAPTRGATT